MTDGSWYSGTPCGAWPRARACAPPAFSGPGPKPRSPASAPRITCKFDDKIDDTSRRIDRCVAWLSLPAADRPHFITLYYSEPDHEGHEFGPDAPETKAAVLKMDGLVGKLKAELDATGLPIDLVVVSDHGMVKVAGRLDHPRSVRRSDWL